MHVKKEPNRYATFVPVHTKNLYLYRETKSSQIAVFGALARLRFSVRAGTQVACRLVSFISMTLHVTNPSRSAIF